MKIFFLLLLFITTGTAQNYKLIQENDSILLWQKNRPLTYSDFSISGQLKRIDPITSHGGEIVYKFSHIYSNDLKYGYTIAVYFLKKESWLAHKEEASLIHEQIHFDIAELYARKIRKVFEEYKLGVVDYKTFYAEKDNLLKLCFEEQDLFDNQTFDDGKNLIDWQKRICKKLNELDQYKIELVTL